MKLQPVVLSRGASKDSSIVLSTFVEISNRLCVFKGTTGLHVCNWYWNETRGNGLGYCRQWTTDLNHSGRCLLCHVVDSGLVPEPVTALHCVVHVPSPVVLLHVAQGCIDTSLCGGGKGGERRGGGRGGGRGERDGGRGGGEGGGGEGGGSCIDTSLCGAVGVKSKRW